MNSFFLFGALLLTSSLVAQTQLSTYNWLEFEATSQVSSTDFWEYYAPKMKLSEGYEMKIYEESADEYGFSHYRYQQYHKGYKVEGAQYLLHIKDGKLSTANGRLVANLKAEPSISLNFNQALEIAKKHVTGTVFYWELPEMEKLIQHIHDDPNATFFPKEEIVWVHPRYVQDGKDYKLAYKLELYFEGNEDHKDVFVDASTGEILHELEGCHTTSKQGTAVTKYHGTVDIIADSLSTNGRYVLRDATRGGGIETYNMQKGTRISNAVHFEDLDNYWNNANANVDEVAGDVHWATEMTYDYFKSAHNRKSYNDRDGKIVSYVHYDNNWANASWNGQFARYGDGRSGINPLTSIDVISHELSHGVTGNSAGLVYSFESGALNESFSDIFGTAAEFTAFPSGAKWEMGATGFILRDISNPKRFSNPDTYLGAHWEGTSADNGGVHTNSGVQNYWFYLLCQGGTGTNDNGKAFNVPAIGMEKAAKIAYRNLTVYLTSSSQYIDARNGALQAAKDLYGDCSPEANATVAAWYAVGIGSPVLTDDVQFSEVLSPQSNCDLGSAETISIKFNYDGTGCNKTISAGDTIKMGYSINGGSAVVEDFILNQNLSSGGSMNYTFQTKQDLSSKAAYDFDFFISYGGDLFRLNDSAFDVTIKNQLVIDRVDTITFEHLKQSTEDPLYSAITGSNAKAYRFGLASNPGTGSFGIALTGNNFDITNFQYHVYEKDNFIKNPEFLSKVCMCVDAREWSKLSLKFDLRQTYSKMHTNYRSFNRPEVQSSLRITANGTQIGNQFHPRNGYYSNEPWDTKVINLDSLAGMELNLCFEGMHFINIEQESVSTYGDNSFIDNVYFLFSVPGAPHVGVSEALKNESRLSIYPNPNDGQFYLSFDALSDESSAFRITNAHGQVVLNQNISISSGENLVLIDMDQHAQGMYFIHINVNGELLTERFMVK